MKTETPDTGQIERERQTSLLIDIQRILSEYTDVENPHLAVRMARYVEHREVAATARFDLECKVGVRLIEEYFALKPYILNALPQKGKESYGSPIIELKVNDRAWGGSVNVHIDEYLPSVRGKYWTVLVNDPRYTGQYTENIQQDLREKLTELRNCDFNRFNIFEPRPIR